MSRMNQIEERDGKLIFQSVKGTGDRVVGIFLLALSGLICWWGFGGSFSLEKILEPLTFIRGAVTFAIAFSIVRLGAAILFKRRVTEISTISGSIRCITKFLGHVKIDEYERGDYKELVYRDLFAETAEKYSSVETSEVRMQKVYSLSLKIKNIGSGWNGEPTVLLYTGTDGEKVRQWGERVGKILGMPLKEKKYVPKQLVEKEVIFKNDGPTIGAIFEQKHEGRDLYYSFYQVISDTNDTLKLLELAVAQIGESGPGDQFGWLFPEIDALKELPRDTIEPEESFDASANPSSRMSFDEDQEDDDEDFDDGYLVMDELQEPREIIVIRDGSVYRDRNGKAFQRWDGTRKPYREV